MARSIHHELHHFCWNHYKTTANFSRFSIPDFLVSDYRSTFTSAEFSTFCQQNSIQYIWSLPFPPQLNRQVDHFIDTFKRALLKLKGKGTTPEIIQIFSQRSRATRNQNVPDSISPSEPLTNQKICLLMDVILPVPRHFLRNTVMENYFNNKHGYVQHVFLSGQSMLTKDYQGFEKWAKGHIVRCKGFFTNVNVQSFM